ncbi:histidine--tRNA ligase, partial [Rickettsiaceae bacterium]|nr:histidine--tRNA ligase [Rickettsiaceae bacterium]
DVVSKEMYNFQDKKGRDIALRPEFTAGVIRAFISHGLKQQLPQKLFSSGPLFRYDRPQEGRQRQFHQLNCEYIGARGAYSDAETISLASSILDKLDILNDTELELNSLGCMNSKENYQQALREYFTKYRDDLSEDSKNRIEKNPLRILDSKTEADKKISVSAPDIAKYYTKDSLEYFDNVKSYLEKLGIKYVINPKLARGMDYYSHTIFEFITSKLGSQGTVLAGGRYDSLLSMMGESEDIPSIGFAAGVERIALMGNFNPQKRRTNVIIPIGDDAHDYAVSTASLLRSNNICVSLELSGGKMAKRVQSAVAMNARFIIFLGSDEVGSSTYKVKDLDSAIEKKLGKTELLDLLHKR